MYVPNPKLPSPAEFGWKFDDASETYIPVMTNELPTPESVIELSMCGCKTGCQTERSK